MLHGGHAALRRQRRRGLDSCLIGQDPYEQSIADNEWIVCKVVLGTVVLGNKEPSLVVQLVMRTRPV